MGTRPPSPPRERPGSTHRCYSRHRLQVSTSEPRDHEVKEGSDLRATPRPAPDPGSLEYEFGIRVPLSWSWGQTLFPDARRPRSRPRFPSVDPSGIFIGFYVCRSRTFTKSIDTRSIKFPCRQKGDRVRQTKRTSSLLRTPLDSGRPQW